MSLAVVEVGQIFEVIWVSIAAGVGIVIAYSLAVVGMGRSAEARREGRGPAALVYGAIGLVFLAVFVAMIVLGVQIMLSKQA